MAENEDTSLYMLLGEMRGDLKSIIGSLRTQRDDHKRLQTTVDDHKKHIDTRLTALEQFRWKVAGIALLVPFLVTALGWYIRSI